ncbi:MAG: DoxX family protein [Myxococcales bacterium]|nr:DoxX family protein [Myxococcales bacterium]
MRGIARSTRSTGSGGPGADWGLLLLRLGAGATMLSHGLPKLLSFAEKAARFPDPFGLGSTASLGLTVFAEVGCALALILGLYTRLASIPLIITMAVAAFVIHADDAFGRKELALLYLLVFVALALLGPGPHSIDGRVRKKLGWW